ncbi:MAG: flagellin lysine-N-methylase [Oscillospiraceae bacterium]|nr:flagellin lysine-N-methylase [Oscillospiraceae bacterium]
MKIITPDYYEEFHCVGGACPDNCCIGWEIDIDNSAFEKYMTFTGNLGTKLKNNIVISNDGSRCFKLTADERCPFLNENNLCEIILESGESALCDICSNHPRFYNCFGDIRETGIGLGCIKAAQIIINKQESAMLLFETTDEPSYEIDYNKDFFEYLYKLRGDFISIIQNRSVSISQRVAELLFTAEKLQSEINNGDTPDSVKLNDFIQSGDVPNFDLYRNILGELCPLNSSWTDKLSQLTETEVILAKQYIAMNENVVEQLITYYIFRHFLCSVYDYDILSRIKLAVFCTVLSFWFIEDKANTEQFMEMICESACLISKEIEYCSENIDLILDYSYTDRCMSSEKLAMLF